MKAVFPPTLICAGFFLSIVSGFADTVTLKTGEILNGTVLSENDKEIVMDVTFASGITDQKTVAKADVQTVSKTTVDQAAFEPIKDLAVGPRSLALAGYDPIIKSLEAFVAKYPQSAHAADVKTRIEDFKKDQAQVKTGALKWANRWYKREEIEKNKEFLSSQMLLATMKEQAARRDFVGALNTFAAIEKSYAATRAYPEAVELAQNQMRVAAIDMERMRVTAKVQEDQFNSGVQLAGEPQKSQMIAARQAQIAASDAAIAAVSSQVKWKPLLPLSKKSFDALKTTLGSEAPRINKIPFADMRQSLEISDAAEIAIQAKNMDEAEAKIKEAQALWKENPQLAALVAKIKSLKDELKRKAPATSGTAARASAPAATPSATPTPTPKHWYGF